MVPNLKTTLTGPLLMLEKHFLDDQSKVESWFRLQWQRTAPPFYSSVDLRNSGFKLAPVDTNLFSAGFNNLNPSFLPLCIHAIQTAIARVCPSACKVLLIPENHTRNTYYLENLVTLRDMLEHAGLAVRIGSLAIEEELEINLPSGKRLTQLPIILKNDNLQVEGFIPCVCLLNNDLSDGIPEIFQQAKQSLFIPPVELGWSNRLKSDHFSHYQDVAREFAKYMDFDPWFIDPLFSNCGDIDFNNIEEGGCLEVKTASLLSKIQKKYDLYGINKKPFVLIKSDNGTYGMGIMVVHDSKDVVTLNRKQRKKMNSGKGGSKIDKVILQEGVYTFETIGDDNAVCEPVVYMIDKDVVGGFYRVHTGRGESECLNSPGMHFEPLSFAQPLTMPNKNISPDSEPNRFYAYGVVARLAMLAAAREINEVLNNVKTN